MAGRAWPGLLHRGARRADTLGRPHAPRRRLSRKYALTVAALVAGAVLATAGVQLYFTYVDVRESASRIRHEKALAASLEAMAPQLKAAA